MEFVGWVVVWFVCFFKQKTAYEMRISDWSSDVCSSDLAQRQPWLEVRVRLDEPQPDLRHQVETALQGKAVRLVRIAAEYAGSGGSAGVDDGAALVEQIGRASCRDRVCQYGKITVVAGTLKKK